MANIGTGGKCTTSNTTTSAEVDEAKEAYTGDGVVHVRSNETEEEMEETVKFIAEELLGAKLR